MGDSQQFSLRWNNYLSHITCAFDSLRSDEDFVDVTLSCEGKKIRAHKMLLSACSTYFRDLFKENPCQHPVIIFRNVRFEDLSALVDFMYQGEVNVLQEQLSSFLTTAELLAVQGLSDGYAADPPTPQAKESPVEESPAVPPVSLFPITAPGKRRKRANSAEHRKRRQTQEIKTEAPDYDDHDGSSGSFEDSDQISLLLANNSNADHHLDYTDSKDSLTDINSITLSQPGTSTDATTHDTSHGDLVCKVCGQRFKRRDAFSHHKNVHRGHTKCPVCAKIFTRKYTMMLHLAASHAAQPLN